MNNLLTYPIGAMEKEDSILEALKDLMSREANHLLYTDSENYEVINIYINAYRLRKEGC